MTTDQIRSKFLDFFKSKGHTVVASDSLVPKDDPTVLFTTAGMQQFKPQFLGRDLTYKRAATCQKCLRTDDLDVVGKTDFHHTFFEMLGNFSFGDYFKKEAIAWAFEFLTKELKLPQGKLWVSVYKDDEEAYGIWANEIKVPPDRIVKLGDKSNFWPSNARLNGPNGPCGPCSEIFYDYGVNPNCPKGKDCDPDCSCGRFSEVWNLVFTQFNRQEGGKLEPLPAKNIDTGMGLERLAAVVQGKKSNYETDNFSAILGVIKETVKANGGKMTESEYRIIADHMRAVTFGIADGVVPSNEGRGYVMRKLIVDMTDLAIRGGVAKPVIHTFVDVVAKTMGQPYPEVKARADEIKTLIKRIEEAFIKIRREKIPELEVRVKIAGNDPVKLGEIFFLYRDTYGLPFTTISATTAGTGVISVVAQDEGTKIFEAKMEEQKNRSRAGSKMTGDVFSDSNIESDVPKTEFLGYSTTKANATVLKITNENNRVKIILDRTPFYAESGGQVGDKGRIHFRNGFIEVGDTQKINDIFIHDGIWLGVRGDLKEGDEVRAEVDEEFRLRTKRSHTATHLLQAALREILGSHIKQQGSLVRAEHLRFDFSNPIAVGPENLKKIEDRLSKFISNDDKVKTDILFLEEARKTGALAFFAEKYGQKVRVVSIGDYSKEFCGGTHVNSTGEIEAIKVISEGSVAQGIRRIQAITGKKDIERFLKDHQSKEELKESQARQRDLEKKQQGFRLQEIKSSVNKIIQDSEVVNNVNIITYYLSDANMGTLRNFSDALKQKVQSAAIVLGTGGTQQATILFTVTDNLINNIKANELIIPISRFIGGSGGGSPNMAQAGSKHPERVLGALEEAKKLIKEKL